MVGESGYKNGVLHRYYKCASAKRHECKKKPIRKDVIEDGIKTLLRKGLEIRIVELEGQTDEAVERTEEDDA